MSHQSSQFNGDGQQHTYRIRVPHALALGIVNYVIANGLTVNAAASDAGGLTMTITGLGLIASLVLISLARWIIRS